MPNHVGYIRVSTVDQNTDRQLDGIHLDKVFIDKASGSNRNRPRLKDMLEYLREGDTVHVHSIDRLARNTTDLNNLVNSLNDKGITIIFHKENLTFSHDSAISAINKLMFQMLAAFSEFERSMILERQREGIAKAKAKGSYSGRKKKVDYAEIQKAMKVEGATFRSVAKQFDVGVATVQRALKAATTE
ncbi:TPA: resolvase [Acinetobacter baumannii]|jgi:DNA invertase Pin-like site-specific DNA recombinase|uniref:DNA-invertase hin n=1 Tax=Escherichia coli TaxID=562 RepID=A0A899NCS1_ECOLX|nr:MULTISPECIES: recombinase family protein [Gammaproteobacteria]HAV4542541.1 resolvase [Acinetobacter baumannii]MDO5543176.1 recombinase family protein [Acinetobacter sp.]QSM61955.1 DNA-invertase hin [Escherichia coli]HAV4560655.1 resolvase [Acinetobacter baumannii]HAV4584101.1 resolvase [Acinetobacter baumannii]